MWSLHDGASSHFKPSLKIDGAQWTYFLVCTLTRIVPFYFGDKYSLIKFDCWYFLFHLPFAIYKLSTEFLRYILITIQKDIVI